MDTILLKDYVRKRCSDYNFNVSALSRELQVSESYLRESVHRICHCSPSCLIETLRIQRAIDYMSDTSLGLYSIMQKSGYSCSKTFRRAVTKRLGKPPSYIKNRIKESKDKRKETDKWMNILWAFKCPKSKKSAILGLDRDCKN